MPSTPAASLQKALKDSPPDAGVPIARALDVVTDVFVVFDRDFRLVYHNEANRAAMRAAGMDPDAALGKYVLEAMPQIAGTAGFAGSKRALEERVVTEWEESYGPDVRLRGRAYPTDDGGVLVVATNVSAEWRAREQASDALARARRLQAVALQFGKALRADEVAKITLTHGLAALRAAAGVVYVFDESTKMLRLTAYDGMPGEALAQWMEVPLDSTMMISDAVRHGRPLYFPRRAEALERYPTAREANKLIAPDAWAAIPLVGDGRTVGGLALGFADLPEFSEDDRDFIEAFAAQCAQALDRARLYEEAAQAREVAEQANRVKSDFLAAMSHELRTPLNAIGGYTDLIAMGLRGPLTAAQEEDLRRIARNQTHLLSIINDILNFARLESGAVGLDIGVVRARDLVTGLEPLVAPQLGQRQLTFTLEPCDDAVFVRADRERVQQILLNLLTNAAKFTEPGGEITVRVRCEPSAVCVDVRDTGAGIAADKLGAIFEPFVQLHRSLSHPASGTGLGLAISRDLARKMGGDITVESTLGIGSTFTLRLPLAQAGHTS